MNEPRNYPIIGLMAVPIYKLIHVAEEATVDSVLHFHGIFAGTT